MTTETEQPPAEESSAPAAKASKKASAEKWGQAVMDLAGC